MTRWLAALALTTMVSAQGAEKMAPAGALPGTQFGRSVAFAASGTTRRAVVAGLGQASVFTSVGGGPWVEEVLPRPIVSSQFGAAVAISEDGQRVFCGAPQFAAESVFVYEWVGGAVTHVDTLSAGAGNDGFGRAVAAFGSFVVVGAPYTDGTAGSSSGVAYVFAFAAGAWSQLARLEHPNGAASDNFGAAVAIDGTALVVAAPRHDSGGQSDAGGAVRYLVQGGWPFDRTLEPAQPVAGQRFGSSVAMSGATIVVGATAGIGQPGSAFVFEAPTWTPYELVPAAGSAADEFGRAVGVLAGGRVVVASPADAVAGVNGAGAVELWSKTGATWGMTTRTSNPDPYDSDSFALSLATSGDQLLVGTPFDDDACGQPPVAFCNSGSAYWFDATQASLSLYCMCAAGPCGNSDGQAGCGNSSGLGARLDAVGSTSLTTNDLDLTATGLPANAVVHFVMGTSNQSLPIGDGQLCVLGGSLARFPAVQSSVQGAASLSSALGGTKLPLAPGADVYVQAWYADPSGPCGQGSNLTNALAASVTP